MISVLMVHEEKRLERRIVEDREKMRLHITEWKSGDAAPCYTEELAFDLLTYIQVAEKHGFEVVHRFDEPKKIKASYICDVYNMDGDEPIEVGYVYDTHEAESRADIDKYTHDNGYLVGEICAKWGDEFAILTKILIED